MIESFVGHKPHVTPLEEFERDTLHGDLFGSSIINAEVARDPKEKYFFIWVDGYKGNGFVWASEFEAKIVMQGLLPKTGLLRKVELEAGDKRTIEELKFIYPWPLSDVTHAPTGVELDNLLEQRAAFPAMYGGETDAQR